MEEKMNILSESELESVSGGASSAKKHVQIIGCKRSCNVRSAPNSDSTTPILGQAYLGDRYVFHSWSGTWAKVTYGNRIAYIYKRFVKLV